MVQINHLFGIKRLLNKNLTRKLELKEEEVLLLKQDKGGFDTVSFSSRKSEKFADVRDELAKNVPDSTTTIEEKEKAISYIDRMLKCSDITPEMKNYWANKKDIILMEIQKIKNRQQSGKDSNYQDVVEEYNNFIQQHWCDNYPTERNENLKFSDREEYGLTFYNTCISYLNRILACEDLPKDARTHFEEDISHWNGEKQSRLGEINWHNQNNNIKTESFNDVFAEMMDNVPDRTTTLTEKQLAAGYIKRMILCDDITPEIKNYWSNKMDIIRMEIQNIINEQQIGEESDWEAIAKEWNEITSLYWNKKPVFENVAERVEYYRSYYNMYISFCDRMLACDNLPQDLRAEWTEMRNNALFDLNNHMRDLARYEQEQNR